MVQARKIHFPVLCTVSLSSGCLNYFNRSAGSLRAGTPPGG